MSDSEAPAWMVRLVVGDEIQQVVDRISAWHRIPADDPRHLQVPVWVTAARAEIGRLRAELPSASPMSAPTGPVPADPARAAGICRTFRRRAEAGE